ncbi:hypothetical protein FNV43_RR20077 [Rhamnella rubrinervis]|uniref:CLAVATA3/ESR (CLE)-related protein 13 n=1 Tax=Rhamnella rubrinervis TaxID=2594499 RepID=A0A8K0DZZ9_9ROSA|nr:hypothetical protein FNV43_RR20077 [Rhamnella rubrinervis]
MALKLSLQLFSFILWLSFFFLFLHACWFTFSGNIANNSTFVSPFHHHHMSTSSNRKLLAGKVDFTPYLRHRHHRHGHRRHTSSTHGPGGSDIDPRYGVEKRLVPTGPNPLHH